MQYAPDPVLRRFIPAGAGNSRVPDLARNQPTVYPRWRGELNYGYDDRAYRCGLSPLARGTRKDATPARGAVTVYPRWRGELISTPIGHPRFHGLSPLARGTL